MVDKVYNSVFENSIRIVLLLDVFGLPENLDMIYCVDFMVSYGRFFDLSRIDLNGENPYMFSEFAARRKFVKEALKELVLYGMVKPINANDGIVYQITEIGRKYSRSLTSDYAKDYRSVAQRAIQSVSGQSANAVISRINKMSAMHLRREATR